MFTLPKKSGFSAFIVFSFWHKERKGLVVVRSWARGPAMTQPPTATEGGQRIVTHVSEEAWVSSHLHQTEPGRTSQSVGIG